MATEQLTYQELAAKLGVSVDAARAVARRLQFPKGRTNDGKALLTVDFDAIRHRPQTKSPTKQQAAIATLKARIAELEAECQRLHVALSTARSDVLNERDRAERLIADKGTGRQVRRRP